MSGPVDWASVLEGERAFQPQSWAVREAERIRLNEPHRRRWDEEWADESRWAVRVTEDGETRRYDSRAEMRRLADEGTPLAPDTYARFRGTWHGGAARCPECTVERRAAEDGRAVHIDRADHEHFRSDMRLQERLLRLTQIRQAEASGAIREGTFIEVPGRGVVATNDVMAQMLEHERAMAQAAQLRQRVANLGRPAAAQAPYDMSKSVAGASGAGDGW